MMKQIISLLLLLCSTVAYAQQQDSVTIRGRVTDYNGQPIDSATVEWKNPSFDTVKEVLTDKDGNYTARIPKGKYQSMACIRMSTYPNSPALHVSSEADMRLEFWAWDFMADRDTTLNIRYHRMEAYGLRAFRIPGATPAYQIYVRPMSLTRFLQWQKESEKQAIRGEGLNGIEQSAIGEQAQASLLAPPINKLKATVWIDGEEVPLLMKQEIKEYFDASEYGNAYLLTVNLPKKESARPYRIFKVELEDLENGDRGEGLYYMEKENYIQ
nr:carboxypeptidase-like regulatory domain-containing protein [Bacteroides helcogenes]